MIKRLRSNRVSKFFAANVVASLILTTVVIDRAVAADSFNLNFDGTLTGVDPFGTTATSQSVNGSFLLNADTVNNSPTPVAGEYNGAIQGLNLTFPSTPNRSAVTLSAADFPSQTNQVFVGPGAQEELQVLYGNVAAQAPFFQPRSVGVIFDSSDLPRTTQLKDVLQSNSSGTFTGQFKLVLSSDQVTTPNNSFSGSFSITPVPEPDNTPGLVVSLCFACLFAARIKGKGKKFKRRPCSTRYS